MASLFEDFGISDEKLTFSGSSDDDLGFAKTFWQSVSLVPHMESRLVSTDIKQRLRSAPLNSTHVSNRTAHTEELLQEQKQAEFLQKLFEFRRMDELERLERYAYIREANRALLEKHRQCRIQKEEMVLRCTPWKKLPKIKRTKKDSSLRSVTCDDYEDRRVTAQEAMQDIENFERNILGLDDDDDSKEEMVLRCTPWKKLPKIKRTKKDSSLRSVTCDDYEDRRVTAQEAMQDIENFERNILGLDDDDDSVIAEI